MYMSVCEVCTNVYGCLMRPEDEGASPELESKVAVSHPLSVLGIEFGVSAGH